jgi:hypothetical protein
MTDPTNDPAEEGAYDAADFEDKPVSTPEQNDEGEDKEAMLAWWLEAEAKWQGERATISVQVSGNQGDDAHNVSEVTS